MVVSYWIAAEWIGADSGPIGPALLLLHRYVFSSVISVATRQAPLAASRISSACEMGRALASAAMFRVVSPALMRGRRIRRVWWSCVIS